MSEKLKPQRCRTCTHLGEHLPRQGAGWHRCDLPNKDMTWPLYVLAELATCPRWSSGLTVADALTVPEVRALAEAAQDVTGYQGRTNGPEYLRVMVMLSVRAAPFLAALTTLKEESHE